MAHRKPQSEPTRPTYHRIKRIIDDATLGLSPEDERGLLERLADEIELRIMALDDEETGKLADDADVRQVRGSAFEE